MPIEEKKEAEGKIKPGITHNQEAVQKEDVRINDKKIIFLFVFLAIVIIMLPIVFIFWMDKTGKTAVIREGRERNLEKNEIIEDKKETIYKKEDEHTINIGESDNQEKIFSKDTASDTECFDSDGGYYPFEYGYGEYADREKTIKEVEDICVGDSVMEVVCDNNGYIYNGDIFNCPYGCYNGVCSECDEKDNCVSDFSLSCFDYQNINSCQSNTDCGWVDKKGWLDGYCTMRLR